MPPLLYHCAIYSVVQRRSRLSSIINVIYYVTIGSILPTASSRRHLSIYIILSTLPPASLRSSRYMSPPIPLNDDDKPTTSSSPRFGTPPLIDNDEHEQECKCHLSIVPSSSFSNFPSGLEGLATDAQNSHHYHQQPPPLSAISDVSASMSSDHLSEAAAVWVLTWVLGKNQVQRSSRSRTRLQSRCGDCMHA